MSLIQVGLVDSTRELDPEFVQSAAAALNVQITRDLPQFWPSITATVQYLPNSTKIPAGVWPIQLVKSLPPGEGGFHMDKHNQPYAKVIASTDSEDWTIDASHELVEMLVDPYGNRLQSSTAIGIVKGAIEDTAGQFEYLVEAADPCEANNYAYPIQGIAVSDFITPHFYDQALTDGTRYSFTGAIKRPREILPGGYISFVNSEAGEVQQILWVDPSKKPQLQNLGPVPKNMVSLRLWIDNKTDQLARLNKKPNLPLAKECRDHRSHLAKIALARAKLY